MSKKINDETTQIKVVKKGKKHIIVEDLSDDYSDLEKTREFKNVFLKDNQQVIRYHPRLTEGLNSSEVEQRKKDGLTNRYKDKNQKTIIGIICKNLFTFLNILLYSIAIILFAVGAELMNCFFLVIITCNLLIGIYQEIKAKIQIDKLSVLADAKATVIRNGVRYEVFAHEIVLDDLVVLTNGRKICADSIVKEGEVEVNESLLTGESIPVKKKAGDFLFAGSFISSGSCISSVERVGANSYASQLQAKVKKVKKNESQILNTLNKIIRWISYIIIPLGIAMFFFAWSREGFSNDGSIIKAVILNTAGSMVAMIPSGLYLTTSITLFVAMINLSKDRALVRDSYSVESLARVNVLCLDKTGTITDGTMKVENEIIYDDQYDYSRIAFNLFNSFEDQNPTSLAILEKYNSKEKMSVIKKLPFSSSRKMTAVEFENFGCFVIGAPEFILSKDDELVKNLGGYTLHGYRVILMAKVDGIEDDKIYGKPHPIVSFVIKDHIREEAYDTIKWFKENNVDIKIISGDNPLTVSVIAKEVGVTNADQYVSLEGMTLDEVSQVALKYSVFGRVAPEQKATLVSALKKAGKTVAMTGDGVNDILAMKRSDCSVAMASGSEACRNVAQLVLMNNNFASMPKIVKEGRRVINNVQAVASLFLMKTIFAIILTLTTLYPYIPMNLQVLEFVVIGVPSFLLALQPNHNIVRGDFFKNVLSKCIPAAFSLILATLLCLVACNFKLFDCREDMTQTMGGMSISFLGLIILTFYCYPFNLYRTIVFVGMILIGMLCIFVPPLINFEFTGFLVYQLSLNEILVMIATIIISGIVFFIGEYISSQIIKKYEKTNS